MTIPNPDDQTKSKAYVDADGTVKVKAGIDGGGMALTEDAIADRNVDGAADVPSIRTLGTGAEQAAPGDAYAAHTHTVPVPAHAAEELSGSTTTSSTSFVTLDSDALTVQEGSYIIAHYSGVFKNSVSGDRTEVGVRIDGGSDKLRGSYEADAGRRGMLSFVQRFGPLSAGSHTVDVRWRAPTGSTATLESNTSSLVLEEKFASLVTAVPA
jgi:hypothetical protein